MLLKASYSGWSRFHYGNVFDLGMTTGANGFTGSQLSKQPEKPQMRLNNNKNSLGKNIPALTN